MTKEPKKSLTATAEDKILEMMNGIGKIIPKSVLDNEAVAKMSDAFASTSDFNRKVSAAVIGDRLKPKFSYEVWAASDDPERHLILAKGTKRPSFFETKDWTAWGECNVVDEAVAIEIAANGYSITRTAQTP